ncbi:uncharacterized protein LOC119321400 [Triticum dicoccoides]|uniref:uncharacterized protein LOC119321400 n=1 Tax=Triticum dicoccoides TaxID=85692 RepID=UPI0018913837|nr:uncharacterized protein LOC119321400 [Triticum dicoccoides]
MLHVACSGCVVGGDEDGGGHGDDDDGYECASCTDLAASAVYVKSSYLDTLFSGFAPCLCPECSFEGSPADLVRHLTDKSGKHGWAAHKITYGKDHEYAIDAQKSKGKHHELLVAEEDGALFLLVIEFNGDAKKDFVFLVRVTNKAGAVYSSSVAVESPPAVGLTVMVEKKVMASPRRVVDRDYFIPEPNSLEASPTGWRKLADLLQEATRNDTGESAAATAAGEPDSSKSGQQSVAAAAGKSVSEPSSGCSTEPTPVREARSRKERAWYAGRCCLPTFVHSLALDEEGRQKTGPGPCAV